MDFTLRGITGTEAVSAYLRSVLLLQIPFTQKFCSLDGLSYTKGGSGMDQAGRTASALECAERFIISANDVDT